jgi:predicted ATPase
VPSYVLTGAPGDGKTAILRLLGASGHRVVEEAAADVIALGNALGRAEPWHDPGFIDKVITLQRQRQESIRETRDGAVFFDRSPACTFQLIEVPAGPLADRVALIKHTPPTESRLVTEFLSWPLGIDSWPPTPQPLRRRSAIVRDARWLAVSKGAGGVERAGISLDESKNLLLNVVFRM